MADLTHTGKNSRKKTISLFSTEKMSTENHTIGVLPSGSLITEISVITSTADTTADSNIDVKIGNTVVGNDLGVASTGVDTSTTKHYIEVGGIITTVAGGTAPAGDGVVRVVITYLEINKGNGDYTS
jgi:hypothetical protein